jgi:hypothetical protein
MTEPIKRRPKWLRFSLRTLLVAMTVLCVWLGFKVNAARRQKEAVAMIRKAHGGVFFDYEMVEMPGEADHLIPAIGVSFLSKIMAKTFPPVNPDPSPSGPVWLRKLLGDEYFREVYQVSVNGPQYDYINETEFAQLSSLTEVRNLFLTNIKIAIGPHLERPLRDSDLAVLQNMRKLQDLIIESAGVSDEGLPYLKRLTKLTRLDLRRTGITPQGIRELQQALPNCKIVGP